jgi:hypothetical protein
MNPAFSTAIESLLAIAAKDIVLHLLGRLGHFLRGNAHGVEVAGTEKRIEGSRHEVAMVQGYIFRKAQAAITDLHSVLPGGKC